MTEGGFHCNHWNHDYQITPSNRPAVDNKELFAAGLGLSAPWYVKWIDLDTGAKQLSIEIDFHKGAEFTCPECNRTCPVHDTRTTKWRHLDFWEHKTILTARHPRTKCDEHGIRLVTASWGRKGSGFSFMFEAMILTLAPNMPMNAIARHVREPDTKLWRVLIHHVTEARESIDFSEVTQIGVDETSSRRRHEYITLFVDLAKRRVLFGTSGKDAETFARFVADFIWHGGDPEAITDACIDLSQAFKKGVGEFLPNVSITFDKFHVVKLLNEAMDEVRRKEHKKNSGLKKTRYLWLRNPDKLDEEQRARLQELKEKFPECGRAYQMKETFLAIYDPMTENPEEHLETWLAWTEESGLEPFEKFAATVRTNQNGIVKWFRTRIANGILEAINSLVQAAKAKARGYRNDETFINMAYLIAGRLRFNLPTNS